MDLGLESVPSIIASSTTGYMVELLPIFGVVGGLVIAFVVGDLLIDFIRGATSQDSFEKRADFLRGELNAFNAKADELEDFYRRNGRSGAQYDLLDIRDRV